MAVFIIARSSRRPLPGFTLVELLVVITVISTLVAMLLPVLGKAKTVALEIRCKASLHSLMVASAAYQTDHLGYTIHGADMTYWWPGTDYFATTYFDDDWQDGDATHPGGRNAMSDGVQNICGVGQLMLLDYLPAKAEAIACPQPYTPGSPVNNAYMIIPIDGVRACLQSDWRSDSYANGPYFGYLRTNYVVRGPMMRENKLTAPYKVALFVDHEQDNQANVSLADDVTPLAGGWPTVHEKGFNTAYMDGSVSMFIDPQRILTFNRWSPIYNNQTRWYGNQYFMYAGGYDKP